MMLYAGSQGHQHQSLLASPSKDRTWPRPAQRSSNSLQQHHSLRHFPSIFQVICKTPMLLYTGSQDHQYCSLLANPGKDRLRPRPAQRSSNSLEWYHSRRRCPPSTHELSRSYIQIPSCCTQVVRIINIVLFWPILARTGSGMDLRSAAATAWSGIRGFVGLILALMVSVDTDIHNEPYKLLCLFFMATTACLTIIVQGGVFELVLWVSCCCASSSW